jgi:hypothetical protein
MIKQATGTLAGILLTAGAAFAQGYEHQPGKEQKQEPKQEQKETKSTNLLDDSYIRKLDFIEGTETADSEKSIDVLLGARGTGSSSYSGFSGNAVLSWKPFEKENFLSHFRLKGYAGITSETQEFEDSEDLDTLTQAYGFGLRYFTSDKDFSFAIEPQIFKRDIKYEQGEIDIDRNDLSLGVLAALRFDGTHVMLQYLRSIDGEFDADLGSTDRSGDVGRTMWYARLSQRLYKDNDTAVYLVLSGRKDSDNFQEFFDRDSTRARASLVLDKKDYDLWIAGEYLKSKSHNELSDTDADGSRTRVGPGAGLRLGKNAYLFGEGGFERTDERNGGYGMGGLQVRF